MPKRPVAAASGSPEGDSARVARELRRIVDAQEQLLLELAEGTVTKAEADRRFAELAASFRAIGNLFPNLRPPYPWANLSPWIYEAMALAGQAERAERLAEMRRLFDAAVAVLTGEKPWRINYFADARASFLKDLAQLDDAKLRALRAAIDEVLAVQGNALIGTKWLRPLDDGLWEFRVDNDEAQIRHRAGADEDGDDIEVDVLVRAFLIFDGRRVILLLSAYDKGEHDSRKRQDDEIAEARARATRYRVARKREQS